MRPRVPNTGVEITPVGLRPNVATTRDPLNFTALPPTEGLELDSRPGGPPRRSYADMAVVSVGPIFLTALIAACSTAGVCHTSGVRLTDLGELPGTAAELGGVTAGPGFYAVGVCTKSIARDPGALVESRNPHAGSIVFLERGRDGRLPGTVMYTVSLEGQVGGLAWDGHTLLAVVYDQSAVYAVEPKPGARPRRVVGTPRDGVWGGLAYDRGSIWLHGTDDPNRAHTGVAPHAIYEVFLADGVARLLIPSDASTQGLAWLDGLLVVSVHPVRADESSSIRILDGEDGRTLISYPLPKGLYPHAVSRVSDSGIVLAMQVGEAIHTPMHLYRADFLNRHLLGMLRDRQRQGRQRATEAPR